MEETAHLVGREIALAVSEVTTGELLSADRVAQARALRVLHGLTRHSQVVRAIAVVNAEGKVVASDDFLELGQPQPSPATVFERGQRELVLRPSALLGPRESQLLVPLVERTRLVGYLRIALASARLEGLYAEARRQLGLGALLAALTVGGLGFLLHLQLARRGESVAQAMERALRGETPPAGPRDEFAAALAAAGRLGQELQSARELGTQARQRLLAVSQALDLGVLLLAPGQQLDFANARACELLGMADLDELAARWPAIAPQFVPCLGAPEAATTRPADIELPTAAGGKRWLRCQAYSLAENGNESFLVLIRDRAMIEALETDLCLASQLRGLTRVYRAVTHDLRAPLHSMVLNLELLQQSLQGGEDEREEQLEWLAVLKQEVERLNRSLQALLAETAPPPDQAREVFDAGDVLREIERLLLPQARLQQVELRTAAPDDEVPILGYRDRIKQAILNIAINALEAMPEGGRLGLRLEAAEGAARLAIEDSGPGIPPSARARIFDLHFTTKTSGTGIGLYVARSITEAHGGGIAVDSESGRGSRFEISLPLATAAVEAVD
jgi:signal transduction histidine kinase